MLIDEFLTDGYDKQHSFQYTNYNNRVLVLEGMKNLLICTDKEIVIKLKQGELSIKGSCLKIKEMNKSLISISGKIESITSA